MKFRQSRQLRIIVDKIWLLGARIRRYISLRGKEDLYTLTPDLTVRSNRYYVRCLKKFIRMRTVNNIALSGDYGVGKSSVIGLFQKSLFSRLRKTRVISLLTLPENSEASNKKYINTSGDDIRKSIQREIFRQLYYSERPSSLRLSRYSRIGKIPILIYSVLIIAASIMMSTAMKQLEIDITTFQMTTLLIGLSTCLILAITIHILALHIARFIQSISIMGIGAGGLSLDLTKRGPDFEEAADEFIYYFKKSGCRVVILEDLDRFGDPHIYEELRQLNMLINGAKHIHRKVVFVYALKDSLISTPESRTKLFDAIVPVIPFITQDNVLQKINWIFQQSDFTDTDVAEICKVLARNIKDMRTIKTIRNTAVVMRRVTDDASATRLRDAEIIAIATIREMAPSQYEKLRKGESELDNIYKECLKNKRTKIDNLTKKIRERADIPNTMLDSAREDLWNLITQPLESNKSYIFNSAQWGSTAFTEDLVDKNFWLNFIKERSFDLDVIYRKDYYSTTQKQKKTISIERAISTSNNIEELVDLLSCSEDHYRTELDELLKQDVFQEQHDSGDETNIIKELIRAGAIDESYKLYLSPLSDVSGSVELRTFRIQYLSSRTANFGFGLSDDDVKTLLNEADSIDLQSPAFYNHSIINWLVAHGDPRLDIILTSNSKKAKQLLEFFDWECCRYEEQLSRDYGDTIDGSIVMKGSLNSYIEDDYILQLTQKVARILPRELLLMLSTNTNLRDTVGKEVIFIVTVLNIQSPAKVMLSVEDKNVVGPFLDYYEDTIILNGGDFKMAELRVANNLPTSSLELYHNSEKAKNVLVSNMMFEINAASLNELSTDAVIQKLENGGLSSEKMANIIKNRSSDSRLLAYCLKRPDICMSLTDQAVNAEFIRLARRYKLKLQKEQILVLVNVLSDDYIIDLMLVSDLLWSDYEEILAQLSRPYSNIQLGKRPLLPDTDRNMSLLNKLKYFNVISKGPFKESGSLRLSMKKRS